MTSRTPLRVSFFGGGTDYPEYFERYPGAVLGMAIDKYIYISAMRLEPFIGYSYRLSYRVIEEADDLDAIKHPVFRVVLKMNEVGPGWNFGVLSSLPSRSGLGSSSTFTVGLLKLVGSIKGIDFTRHELGSMACHVERDLLGENVGIQDQFHAAYGSLNRYDFTPEEFRIQPVRMKHQVRDELNASMYLLHTGVARFASEVVSEQISRTKSKTIDRELGHLHQMVGQGYTLFAQDDPETVIPEIGRMLHEGWMTKRGLSPHVSSPLIDELYDLALANGAMGGKLCGAGGGGFLFLLVPQGKVAALQEKLGDRKLIPIRMDETGASIFRT